MQKVSNKKNLSSMQVLKTLQVLMTGDYTMQELVTKLNKEEGFPLFNNSVISKYINTCRFCGINIPKIHNKYFVTTIPFGLELSVEETNLLEILQNVVKNEMSSKCNKIFDKFIENLNRFSNKKLARVDKSTYHISVELFENAVNNNRKVRLMYKNRAILDCVPIKIEENKNKTYFHVMCQDKDRIVDIERISGIEVLNDRFVPKFNEQVVNFKLTGALALRYNLRENETVLKEYDGESITVSNHGESKDILFSRLLRYDDKCEILNPKSYREEMAQIIDSMLSNYEEK